MSMRSEHIMAIESRLRWLRELSTSGSKTREYLEYLDKQATWRPTAQGETAAAPKFSPFNLYRRHLTLASMFFMDSAFCKLVDSARRELPPSITFDKAWMLAPMGWLWVDGEVEFSAPYNYKAEERIPFLQFVSWEKINDDHYQFMCATKGDRGTFLPWSFFGLNHGQSLGESAVQFRKDNPEHEGYSEPTQIGQEMGWIYAASYLMAQRVAHRSTHAVTDRALRRRAEKTQQILPEQIQVITLRRLEEARRADPKGNDIDWQWQWSVEGHWRNQFFPSENVHKPVYIESYVKGPPDKPMKPGTFKLFNAAR